MNSINVSGIFLPDFLPVFSKHYPYSGIAKFYFKQFHFLVLKLYYTIVRYTPTKSAQRKTPFNEYSAASRFTMPTKNHAPEPTIKNIKAYFRKPNAITNDATTDTIVPDHETNLIILQYHMMINFRQQSDVNHNHFP